MQQIRILYGYRSAATDEKYLRPGLHKVDDELADYLITNGHAELVEKPQRQVRKQTRTVHDGNTA